MFIKSHWLKLILALMIVGGVTLAFGCSKKEKATPTPTKVAATSTPAAGTPTPSGGDATRGKTVFAANCTVCHPDGKQGVGPSLIGVTTKLTTQQITTQIRNGKNVMPAFSTTQISDAQLADLLAYLATLK
ncbi:MAG: cytochrome c [Chloroflexi bacterium]|nr:cytochrome c [Chloroflexota bacterium]